MLRDRRRVRAAARLLRQLRAAPAELPPRPPGRADTLAAMEGDVHHTLGELERRLKELEQELESVGRAGEVDAEPAQGGWTPAPAGPDLPPGTTPFTASWSGGAQQPPPGEPPTFNGAPAIPVRPPYWQPVGEPPAQAAPAATSAPGGQPAPSTQSAPSTQPTTQPPSDTAAAQPAQPAPTPPAPQLPTPPAAAEPSAATVGLHRQLDELLAFRERLVASTNDLVSELSRVLADLGAEVEAVDEAPSEPDPADRVLSGQVTVEAGPFGDLSTLAAFEQALQATDGVAAVHVRTLSDGHATIDVTLDEPTRLGAALRDRASVAFDVVEVEDHRLVLAVDAGDGAWQR